MSAPILVFDAAATAGASMLVPPEGAFAHAMRALLSAPTAAAISDRVALELYCYELVERMREHLRTADGGAWHAPFWPAAAFAAADVEAHAGHELEAMWPRGTRIVRRAATTAAVAEAQAIRFGVPLFDVTHYVDHVLADDPVRPGTRVVGMFLARGEEILLEHRPCEAPCYAGCWDTPGGKIEAGEAPANALRREAAEELGIDVVAARQVAIALDVDPTSGAPFVHHAYVVTSYRGQPTPREGQRLRWHPATDLAAPDVNPLLAFLRP